MKLLYGHIYNYPGTLSVFTFVCGWTEKIEIYNRDPGSRFVPDWTQSATLFMTDVQSMN